MRLVLARLVWGFDIGMPEDREENGKGRLDWRSLKTFIVVRKEPV